MMTITIVAGWAYGMATITHGFMADIPLGIVVGMTPGIPVGEAIMDGVAIMVGTTLGTMAGVAIIMAGITHGTMAMDGVIPIMVAMPMAGALAVTAIV